MRTLASAVLVALALRASGALAGDLLRIDGLPGDRSAYGETGWFAGRELDPATIVALGLTGGQPNPALHSLTLQLKLSPAESQAFEGAALFRRTFTKAVLRADER